MTARQQLRRIDTRLNLLTWMVGFNVALTAAVFIALH
jgi:hypothetical protein